MNSLKFKPIILIILDGWGVAPPNFGNAITSAHLPGFNNLLAKFPNTTISASGTSVGLPDNDPGNSEVGHVNIGAGRVIRSSVSEIDEAIKDGSFFKNKALKNTISHVIKNNSNLHLIGLLSQAKVHASIEHLLTLINFTKQNNVRKLFLHLFTDGRDAPLYDGLKRILELENYLQKIGSGAIATLSGRFYGMDRDKKWDRTQKAFDALINGIGQGASIPSVALEGYYRNGITDEFIPPTVITAGDKPVASIQKNDAVIFFNHRGERAVQLTQRIISNRDLSLFFVTLTQYDDLPISEVAFLPTKIPNTLGQIFANLGFRQLRLAESEKGRFVTYYFNGNQIEPFDQEEVVIVQSPTVKTYDLEPQMSAKKISETLIKQINKKSFDFIVVNFANADMVGHTGLFKPTVIACEAIDKNLRLIVDSVLNTNALLFISSDHGNAEEKIDLKTGLTLNEHTRNPVPLIIVGNNIKNLRLKQGGALPDVAPTILKLAGIDIPREMTGKILIEE